MVAPKHVRACTVMLLIVGGVCVCTAGAAFAQHPLAQHGGIESAETKKFVESARLGTVGYLDSTVAIADGYQRIGPEIPAMGEHWIHVGLLFEEGIDPSRPEILSYIRGREGRTLVGVAYAVPLLVGEAPPSVTGLIADWHDHSGGVEEELLRIKPDDLGEDMTQPRVAVVHAWIWAQNPAGLFAADNWTLPFLRQGWDAPAEATVEASKALSLVTGGEAFYIRRLETIGWRDDGSFREVVGRGREAVKDWLAVRSPEAEFTPEDTVTLGAIWDRIWDQLEAVTSPDEVKRLRAIRAR